MITLGKWCGLELWLYGVHVSNWGCSFCVGKGKVEEGVWVLLGEIVGAVWAGVRVLSNLARINLRRIRIAGGYIVKSGEIAFRMGTGVESWLEVVTCKVPKILGKSTATRNSLIQCQVPGVHRGLFGKPLLSHERFGGFEYIQRALRVSCVVVLMGMCAMATAVATSAGPLLVVSGRHLGSKIDRSVFGRKFQPTSMLCCESRTHKRHQRISSRHLRTISALGNRS